MIKTIELTANVEEKIALLGGTHVKIKNLGNSTVYVSKHSGIVASADNVKSIQSSSTEILTDVATYSIENSTGDYRGTIYALADSDCSIELETTNNANFSFKARGGGDKNSTFAKASDVVACVSECNITCEFTSNIKKYPDVKLDVSISEIDGFELSEKAKFVVTRTITNPEDATYKCSRYGFIYSKNFGTDITKEEAESQLVVENIDGTNIKGAYSSSTDNLSSINANITNNGTYKITHFRGYYVVDADENKEYFYTDVYVNI